MKKYMLRDIRVLDNKRDYRDLTLEEACLKFGDLIDTNLGIVRDQAPAAWKNYMRKIDAALTRDGGVAVIAKGITIAHEVTA